MQNDIDWFREGGVDYIISRETYPVQCKWKFDFRKTKVRCRTNQIKAKALAYFDRIRKDERLWK